MSLTPETITNKTAQSFRNFLVGVGIFLVLAGIVTFQNGDNGFWLLLLGGGAFGIASKIKVHWKKDLEIKRFR